MTEHSAVEEIRRAIEKAPLLSANAQRLMQITADTDHELGDVIDIVKCDATLTARVLRVVNSAAYDLLNPISSIDRAVSYLGERMVTCIAIGDSVGNLMNRPMAGYQAAAGELWRHDLFTAFAAREIARCARGDMTIDLAFTAGLLHDIGKAILSEFLHGSAENLVGDIDAGHVENYLGGEKKLLGMDHAEIGLELAKSWQLPTPLQSAIAFHHEPQRAPEEDRLLVYAVHLGDIIAMMNGFGTGSDSMQYQLDQGYQDYLEFDTKQLPGIILEATELFRQAEASLTQNQETES
ncbi:phosphohydrolase [Geothermobacter hydrogeniphilus]|uniref:Phosphohydrolase n=1 Tax=Geothermobacter hydrogeniphilus TaxID=1969733 RepID=A0A2K2HCS5_9BACT|nr:HDOD domain-containing protein [Geothermobacter hydrogeniphilus]PNU21106.1 phosphohydrolase [Geothermobacter hydrogeniphilus]